MASNGDPQEMYPGSHEDRAPLVIGVVVMCMMLSTIVVGARIWTRKMILNQLGIDDYLSIATLFVVLGDGITVATMTSFGLGKHVWLFEDHTILLYMRTFYVSIVLYTASLLFVKLTFLVQYYRVFSIQKMRKIYFVAIVVVAGWGLSQVFVAMFICSPIRGFWDRSVKAKCIPNHTQWLTNAAGNIITDIAVFVLPLPVIKSLKLPRAQKLVLFAIFSLGFFTVAISVIRIRFLRQFDDFTWGNVESSCWSIAELTSALACACLPTLRPLLAQFFPSLASQFSRSSYMRYGTSSFGCTKDIEMNTSSPGGKLGTSASTETQEGSQSGRHSPREGRVPEHQDSASLSDDAVGLKATRSDIALERNQQQRRLGVTAAVRTGILPARPAPVMARRIERFGSRREINIDRELSQTQSVVPTTPEFSGRAGSPRGR